MRGHKITGQVNTPIILGTQHYGSTLTVTGTGAVEPSAIGAAAITAPASVTGAKLVNHGIILGGPGGPGAGENGGGGVIFTNAGFIGNDGTIDGGSAPHLRGGAGGIGIDLMAGGTVANEGHISGGTGYGYYDPGGATGLYLGGIGRVTNAGTIAGGAGEKQGTGGIGIDLDAGGTVVNHGLILGGNGGVSGYYGEDAGAGIVLSAAGEISNTGTIFGGAGGHGDDTIGVGGNGITATSGVLNNQGLIRGGFSARLGGDGVNFAAAAQLSNTGTIEGGRGGGNGVDLTQGGALNNAGAITGGYGANEYYGRGVTGGAGIVFGAGGTIANTGAITGGDGGYYAGLGGAGVVMTGPGDLLNHGTITGGRGNIDETPKYPSVGGDGVMLSGGATLHNTGTVSGGSIIVYGTDDGGNGGAGVYIDGGTLITSGTIDGGAPGANGPGVQGDAVQFGKLAGTLEIAPSAIFSGNIAANASANDTLVLAGSAPGMLAGFGTAVTGFTSIVENAHAHWTLSGTIDNPGHGQGTVTLDTSASLTLTGAVKIDSIAFGGNDLLVLGTPGAVASVLSGFGTGDTIDLSGITAGSLSYAGGTLTLYGPGQHVVDTLAFSGSYTTGDFGLHADGAGGTDIVFTGAPEGSRAAAGFTRDPGAIHAAPAVLAQFHAAPPGW